MSAIRVHTISLGCPKNRVDTERLLGVLGRSFAPAEGVADADLVLVNTCGFIRPAVEESLETIVEVAREAAELAAEAGRRPVVAVAGCLVSRYGKAELSAGLPEGNGDWSKWTPSGELAMTITNPAAVERFEIGEVYALTLAKIDRAPTQAA